MLKSEALFLVDQLRSLRDRAGPSWQRILQAGEHLAEVVQIWNVMVGLYRPRSRRTLCGIGCKNVKKLVSSICPSTTVLGPQ